MKGLELSKAYYEQYGKPMLEKEIPDYIDKIAVGLVGHGSECFGFDDEISRDHDFSSGFCIFIRKQDEQEIGFKLFRAYSKLPDEFNGVKLKEKSAYGLKGTGVHTIEDFYKFYTGREGAPETIGDWLFTPSYYFAEATNGEVFYDPLGEFSRIREEILVGMPEDVRLKKIVSKAMGMAQTGQYNFSRCVSRGDIGAAQIALAKFVEYSCEMVFLLNKTYAPYYKWLLKGAENQFLLGDKVNILRNLLENNNLSFNEKELLVEEFASCVINELVNEGLTHKQGDYLEPYAFSVNENIKDAEIRNMSLI